MNQKHQKSTPQLPDIATLLTEIEARVQKKKKNGLYKISEIHQLEEATLDFSTITNNGTLAELTLRQANLQQLWNPKICGVVTHHPGFLGQLILKVKRLLHCLARPYLNIILARQTLFNDELVKLLLIMISQYSNKEELRIHLKELEHHYESRLNALERQTNSARSKMESLLIHLENIIEKQAKVDLATSESTRIIKKLKTINQSGSYLAFEDLHRGSRNEIKSRQKIYLSFFAKTASLETPILDLGCGRGEFLELCRDHGIPARGVDINPDMVNLCREIGLEVEENDALKYLREQHEISLGGILLAQVIEHLPIDNLIELITLCVSRLKPGSPLIAETINPQSLSVFAGAFYLDLTHIKPIHPEAARFLWQAQGLDQLEIIYLSPVPAEHKLEFILNNESMSNLTDSFNRNIKRLNDLIYGPLDYAIIGHK